MKSPFKFLDPFTLADKDAFFGRQKETRQLHRLVQRTRLLIVYGLSGTGKTSLVQCGLAGEFSGPDWLPLWIRHQSNFNDSLQAAIKRLLPEAEGSIPIQIRRLYQHFLRPVYLLFDQFEELFILGTPTERDGFIATLKTILNEELPCTVLIIIREEYLGRLYPFEKAIPNLFDARLRVEPMDTDNVRKVLKQSFERFNINYGTPPDEARLDDIIRNVSLERSGIELPYLQVFLDRLYQEDFQRTYPDGLLPDNQNWPLIEFTHQEIKDFGTIDILLNKFLNEQIEQIQARLLQTWPSVAPDALLSILNGFVTDEMTKRPVRYERVGKQIVIEAGQRAYLPKLEDTQLTFCLDELERTKILRFELDSMEIAHDSLAKIIYDRRTDEQRERDNMKRQIHLARVMFPRTNDYLTIKQLTKYDEVRQELEAEEAQFFDASRTFRINEERRDLAKEQRRSAQLEKALAKAERRQYVAIAFSIIAMCLGFYAWKKQNEAETEKQSKVVEQQRTLLEKRQTEIQKQQAEANLLKFQDTEFKAYLLDAETFGASKDTVQKRIALDSAKSICRFFSKDAAKAQAMLREIERVETKPPIK